MSPTVQQLIALAFIPAWIAGVLSADPSHQEQLGPTETLRPHQPLLSQLIALDTETKGYRLLGLKPGTGYEVRVSYPASIPATIKFEWQHDPVHSQGSAADGSGASATSSSRVTSAGGGESAESNGAFSGASGAPGADLRLRRRGKKLLDLEKVVFKTDPAALYSGDSALGAAAAAGLVTLGSGPPVLLLSAGRRSVHRDGPGGGATHLVYDIVLAELWLGLPVDSLPVICTAAALLLVAALLTPVWTARLFPALLDWVLCADAGAGAGAGSDARARRGPSRQQQQQQHGQPPQPPPRSTSGGKRAA